MNRIGFLILAYLLVLWQTGFWAHFPMNGAWPNLALLFVLFFALKSHESFSVWLLAIWTGFLLDVLYYGQAGTGMLTMLILIGLVQLTRHYFSLEVWPIYFISLIFLSLVYEPIRHLIIILGQGLSVLDVYSLFIQFMYHMIIMISFWLLLPTRFKQKLLT